MVPNIFDADTGSFLVPNFTETFFPVPNFLDTGSITTRKIEIEIEIPYRYRYRYWYLYSLLIFQIRNFLGRKSSGIKFFWYWF